MNHPGSFSLFLLAGIAAVALFSCDNDQKAIDRIVAERDSLLALTHQQDSAQARIDEYLETIASTIDSINLNERILNVKFDDNGRPLSRKQIKENLEILGQVVHRQRQRIEELEEQMKQRGESENSNYRTLIAHLYKEIDVKNAEIERMEKELSNSKKENEQLKKNVETLTQSVEEMSAQAQLQSQTISEQEQILSAQDQMINTGYVMIGTNNELKKAGLLKWSGKLNPNEIDISRFSPVDIRQFTEVMLSSRNPKLLSTHPAGSYKVETEYGSGEVVSYLTITDPAAFWSLSNFLVVRL